MDVYRKSFVFRATRYEEWMDGQCINGDLFETDIVAEASSYDIQFYISNVGNLEINNTSTFEYEDESTELVLDRIIYSHDSDFLKSKEPVECQLFKVISGISCIRFTLPSPLRVIEFYGSLTKVGPATNKQKKERDFKSDIIISELKKYYKYNADEIMSIAVKELEKNAEVTSFDQVTKVVECLKLFVEVYSILQHEQKETGESPILMPKVYFFIALCNYKIGNFSQAYLVAKAANPIIDQVISESVFENLPREMLGGDDIDWLISHIENENPRIKEKNGYTNVVNPAVIDTGIIDSIARNDKSLSAKGNIEINDVESILSRINHIEASLLKLYEKTCNDRVLKAKIDIEKFKFPCYYAIFYLTGNVHKEAYSQIQANTEFALFINNGLQRINDYQAIIEDESPFAVILKHDDITNELLSLYKKIKGTIASSPDAMITFKNCIIGTDNREIQTANPKTIYDISDFSEEVSRIDSIIEIVNSESIVNRENSRVPDILPEVLLFKSNEHQRYENGQPVMGLQHCQRTIQIEINKGDIQEYLLKPNDGFIVRIYNDDEGCGQMSAKPMKIYRQTDNVVELRGYPVQAITPFGWQPIDYSTYSFLVFFNNGEICQCAMCMLDRGVVIVYRYNNDKQIDNK